jgi:hypothetical protein
VFLHLESPEHLAVLGIALEWMYTHELPGGLCHRRLLALLCVADALRASELEEALCSAWATLPAAELALDVVADALAMASRRM